MKKLKLTREEKEIERALLKGEYVRVSKAEESRLLKALAGKRKDAVLHIRINSLDLDRLKEKAGKAGVPYQTFIAEVLHHIAR